MRPRPVDPRLPPVIIAREELAHFHSWLPFAENWWRTVIGVALASSSITIIVLEYFGRLT